MLPFHSADHPTGLRAMLVIAALLLNTVGALSLEASLSDNARRRGEVRAARRGIDVAQAQYVLAQPVRLRIPIIEVDAPVVPVGMQENGIMDIPASAHEIGWFEPGFHPGEAGSAVLAGHLDRESGRPAVFWDLRRLEPGDVVELEQDDRSVLRYRVIRSETYPMNNAPMEEIFGSATGSRLNLVTCNGAWQDNLETYTKRLVVYTELIR